MRLTVGPRSYDLTTRPLVVGAHEVVVVASEDEMTPAAETSLICLVDPTPAVLARCAEAGVTVIVPASHVDAAEAAGLPPDRIVPDHLFLDVTGSDCAIAATAVGVIRGARVVRTCDLRGAQRICDVLAAVLEAR